MSLSEMDPCLAGLWSVFMTISFCCVCCVLTLYISIALLTYLNLFVFHIIFFCVSISVSILSTAIVTQHKQCSLGLTRLSGPLLRGPSEDLVVTVLFQSELHRLQSRSVSWPVKYD